MTLLTSKVSFQGSDFLLALEDRVHKKLAVPASREPRAKMRVACLVKNVESGVQCRSIWTVELGKQHVCS